MKHRRFDINWTTPLLMAFILFLSIACAPKSTTLNSVTGCTTGGALKANISIASGLTQNQATVGVPVVFSISASGCNGSYMVSRVGALGNPIAFSKTAAASYPVTYMTTASSVTETFQIQSVDPSSKSVISSIDVQAPTFSVVPSMVCTATASNSQLNIPVDGNGNSVGTATFSFQVTTGISTLLYEVDLNGVPVSATNVPASVASKSQNTSVSVGTIGTSSFIFKVKDPVTNSQNSCQLSVTTLASLASAPVITGFSASPQTVNIQSSSVLTLNISGLANSATINSNPVTITNGVAKLTVTPPDIGPEVYTAVVTGPGGSATQTVTVTVNNGCQISAPSQVSYGDNYPFNVTINGAFSSASISGAGLTTVNIAASSGIASQVFNSKVSSVSGPATATLSVVGTGGAVGTCTVPINTVVVQVAGSQAFTYSSSLNLVSSLGSKAVAVGYGRQTSTTKILNGSTTNIQVIANTSSYTARTTCNANEVAMGINNGSLRCSAMISGFTLKNRVSASGSWQNGANVTCPANKVLTSYAVNNSTVNYQCSEIGSP